jgi:ATP-dependent DNA ligase
MTARRAAKPFPIDPPIEPMLAKLSDILPRDGDYLYEPKWVQRRAAIRRRMSDTERLTAKK